MHELLEIKKLAFKHQEALRRGRNPNLKPRVDRVDKNAVVLSHSLPSKKHESVLEIFCCSAGSSDTPLKSVKDELSLLASMTPIMVIIGVPVCSSNASRHLL